MLPMRVDLPHTAVVNVTTPGRPTRAPSANTAPAGCLRLTLLGRMQAHGPGGVLSLPRARKTRAVLAILAIASPEPVLREQMARLLWSQRNREQARASLRLAVHELQTWLQPLGYDLLSADRFELCLNSNRLSTDLVDPPTTPDWDQALLADLVGIDSAFDQWLEDEKLRLRARNSSRPAVTQPRPSLMLIPGDQLDPAIAQKFSSCRPSEDGHARRLTPGPRLGVMPLRSPQSETEGLSLGIAEEITTALSRFRWINSVSPSSLAHLARESFEGSVLWPQLDLDFLLEGTIQRRENRFRIRVQLLDLRAAGAVMWAQRFDRESADIFALQDEIAAQTVAQLDPELLLREGQRIASRPPANTTAYEMMLAAISSIYMVDQPTFRHAGELLSRAVALDPANAAAHAWWAYWHLFLVGQGWASEPAAATAQAGRLAERAVMLDPGDARALTLAGHVRGFLHKRAEEAIALHEKALALNPNLALAWCLSGLAHSYIGEHDEAIRRIHIAKHLSPFDAHGFFFDQALVLAHLLRGEYQTVIKLGRSATELNPTFSSTYKGYLSALGHLGATDEIAVVRAKLLALEPGFSVSQALHRSPLQRAVDRQQYLEGLRLAGLDE
jgi:TolB-like protein